LIYIILLPVCDHRYGEIFPVLRNEFIYILIELIICQWVITPDNTMEIHNYPGICLNITIKDREISIKDETIIIKDGVETF